MQINGTATLKKHACSLRQKTTGEPSSTFWVIATSERVKKMGCRKARGFPLVLFLCRKRLIQSVRYYLSSFGATAAFAFSVAQETP